MAMIACKCKERYEFSDDFENEIQVLTNTFIRCLLVIHFSALISIFNILEFKQFQSIPMKICQK